MSADGEAGVPEESTHSQSVSVAGGDDHADLGRRARTPAAVARSIRMRCWRAIPSSSSRTAWAATSAARSPAPARSTGWAAWSPAGPVTPKAIEKALTRAVKDIASHPETTDDGTGTTLTGVYLDVSDEPPQWVTLNIGDSRVYLLRDDAIEQITTDHSVVQELIAAGRLSPEEAENHPYGNVITRAVGPSDSVTPDYVRLDVVDADRFVICSDGLTKELTDYGIQHFLARERRSRRRGGRDDGCRARERRTRQHHDHRARCHRCAPSPPNLARHVRSSTLPEPTAARFHG